MSQNPKKYSPCVTEFYDLEKASIFYDRTQKVRDTDGTWKNPLSKDSSSGVVKSQPGASGSAVPDAARGGPYIQRINNDAREDEMEDNMQAVGSVLGNLKNMAADMGDEISRQNKQLDRIDRKVILYFSILGLVFCQFLSQILVCFTKIYFWSI